MKKLWLAALVFLFPVISHASIQDEGVTREKTYVVHFTTTVAANTVAVFDLISLSTTANLFPHTINNPKDIGELDVSHVHILMDKVAAATTTIKVGVMTFVNTSTGSVSYFFTRSSRNNVSNTDAVLTANYTPSFYRLKVYPKAAQDGLTPFFVSNEIDSGSAIFNSTTTYQSSILAAGITPKIGDILMKIGTDATNAVNVIVDLWYHAEP